MKRAYTKPELSCEEHELSVSIAGNCGRQFSNSVNHNDPKDCYYNIGGDIIFVNSNKMCVPNSSNEYDGDLFCYMTNSSGDKIIFAS